MEYFAVSGATDFLIVVSLTQISSQVLCHIYNFSNFDPIHPPKFARQTWAESLFLISCGAVTRKY